MNPDMLWAKTYGDTVIISEDLYHLIEMNANGISWPVYTIQQFRTIWRDNEQWCDNVQQECWSKLDERSNMKMLPPITARGVCTDKPSVNVPMIQYRNAGLSKVYAPNYWYSLTYSSPDRMSNLLWAIISFWKIVRLLTTKQKNDNQYAGAELALWRYCRKLRICEDWL